MRPRLPIAAGLAAVLLAAVVGLLFARQDDRPRSETLAAIAPTATERPPATVTPTATLVPTTTNTPRPPPTATPQPPPPPPPTPHVHEEPPSQPPAPQESGEWLDPAFAARVLALVNVERTSRGLAAFTTNGALTRAAESYAHTLLQFDSLTHTANGTDPLGRMRAAGYSAGPTVGEVLWRGVGSWPPERTVADWMASPGHRAIILSTAYREAGVGCYFKQAGRVEARCVLDAAG